MPQLTYALPDAPESWTERMEEACRILERAFPGEELRVATAERGAVTLVRDRPEFFAGRGRTRKRWFSLHSGDPNLGQRCDRPIAFEGYAPTGSIDDVVTLGGGRGGGFEGLYTLHAIFPERSWALHERLLVELGDATRAFSAHLSPQETDRRLRRVQLAGWNPASPSEPEARLPAVAYTAYGGLVAAEQPGFAGWLNYWSDASARFLGFPEAGRDADLLAHSYRTPLGAWLVKLGAEPLDCGVARHLELLRSVYERFPKLGVRVERREA